MKRLLTPEMHKFVVENVKGKTTRELTMLINAKFGTAFVESQVKNYKNRYKLRSETPGGHVKGSPSKVFPAEIKKYIKDNHVGIGIADMAEQLNMKFGTNYKYSQIRAYYKNHGLKCGIDCRFKKGLIPVNKGKKGIRLSPETEFEKGHTPHNTLPVGTELIKADGYIWVKVADPNKWRQKHRIIWEDANGEIPDKHIILFADGNRLNTELDNLRLVSRKKLSILNKRKLISPDPDATDVGINVANVYLKIHEIINKKEGS